MDIEEYGGLISDLYSEVNLLWIGGLRAYYNKVRARESTILHSPQINLFLHKRIHNPIRSSGHTLYLGVLAYRPCSEWRGLEYELRIPGLLDQR